MDYDIDDWKQPTPHVLPEYIGSDVPRSPFVRECELCLARVTRGLLSGMRRLVDKTGNVWLATSSTGTPRFYKTNADGTTQPAVQMKYEQFRELFVWS